MQHRSVVLILGLLRYDAARIPAASLIRYLNAALDLAAGDAQIKPLVLQCALAGLPATHDRDYRDQLKQIATRCGHQPQAK